VTVTGPVPDAVLGPTCQLHDATPLAFAVCGRSPPAVDGPDLYMTAMAQDAPGFVLTVAIARDPFATGEVSEVKIRVRVGAAVAWGGGGASVGRGVGTSDSFGISATDAVAAADELGDAPRAVAAAVAVGCAGAAGVSLDGRDATAATAIDTATTIVAFCRRDAAFHALAMGTTGESVGRT
jgi:hypothetical protein